MWSLNVIVLMDTSLKS